MRDFFTIGHSTRLFDSFIGILVDAGVSAIADVRRFPASRRHPDYNAERLAQLLAGRGIRYRHIPELGGRRRAEEPSPHRALRNDSFRAYATHMSSAEFAAGIAALHALGDGAAILCAEAVPWRCHRNMISDYLVTHGALVTHLIDQTQRRPHTLSELVRIDSAGLLVYDRGAPPEQVAMFE